MILESKQHGINEKGGRCQASASSSLYLWNCIRQSRIRRHAYIIKVQEVMVSYCIKKVDINDLYLADICEEINRGRAINEFMC